MALCWTLDKLGPMCRAADDCGLVLAAIAGARSARPHHGRGPLHLDAARRGSSRKWRVGVLRNGTLGAQPEVKAAFEKSLEVLAGFCDAGAGRGVPGPALGPGRRASSWTRKARARFATSSRAEARGSCARPPTASAPTPRMMTLAVDYLQAMRARVPMRGELDALLSRYDAVVAPTRTRVTYPIGYDFDKPPGPAPAAHAPAGARRSAAAQRARHDPGRQPGGPARGLRPQRRRRAGHPHLAPAPRPRLLRGHAPGHRAPLPAGHGLAPEAPARRPRLRAARPGAPSQRPLDAATATSS